MKTKRKHVHLLALPLAAVLLLALAAPALAGPGDLDPTFDGDGRVTTDFNGGHDDVWAVALQPDGKIVVAGGAWGGSSTDFALARYEGDGSLDTSFGTGGLVNTDFNGGYDYGDAVALQPDGKIVVAGHATVGSFDDFALARYNGDGSLDASFGTGGLVTTDFNGSWDDAWAVAPQPDGKIVVAGHARVGSADDFALARYNSDGSLDTSFGFGGLVNTDFNGSWDAGLAMALQPDGKIVVAGVASGDFALARYEGDGSLDTSFGTGGRVITDFGGYDWGTAVALQPDGKIVVAGYASGNFALARHNTDGSLDISFGTGGLVTTDFDGSGDEAWAVALQPDGKIVAAGHTYDGDFADFALARYEGDGSLDTSFGSGGLVITDFDGRDDLSHAVAVQPDGKIVAAGLAWVGSFYDFALARYEGDEPTAIDLLSFTAQPAVGSVTLAWQTGTEIDNAGFNIYRATAEDGPYARINDALIAAQGDPVSGASYSFLDKGLAAGTYFYKLEDVGLNGVATLHGPVSATVVARFRRPPYRPTLPGF